MSELCPKVLGADFELSNALEAAGRAALNVYVAARRLLDEIPGTFANLGPREGLFFQLAAAGQVDGMPSPGQVKCCVSEPPDNTRAYLRAHVPRRFGGEVSAVNWDRIRFRDHSRRYWAAETVRDLPDRRAAEARRFFAAGLGMAEPRRARPSGTGFGFRGGATWRVC